MPTERDHRAIRKSTIYDIRLIIKANDKQTYTKEEILELLDTVAAATDHD